VAEITRRDVDANEESAVSTPPEVSPFGAPPPDSNPKQRNNDVKKSIDDPEIKEWLEIRKAEGLKIDPETAEVDWD
jgi:hypothetical protein